MLQYCLLCLLGGNFFVVQYWLTCVVLANGLLLCVVMLCSAQTSSQHCSLILWTGQLSSLLYLSLIHI